MDEVLVIRTDVLMRPEALSRLRESILKQKEEGVIVLPQYCQAIIVPKNMEIEFADKLEPIDISKDTKILFE